MNLDDLIEDFDPEAQQSPWTQVARKSEMNATKQILRNARILFNTGCYSVTQAIEDGSNGFDFSEAKRIFASLVAHKVPSEFNSDITINVWYNNPATNYPEIFKTFDEAIAAA